MKYVMPESGSKATAGASCRTPPKSLHVELFDNRVYRCWLVPFTAKRLSSSDGAAGSGVAVSEPAGPAPMSFVATTVTVYVTRLDTPVIPLKDVLLTSGARPSHEI